MIAENKLMNSEQLSLFDTVPQHYQVAEVVDSADNSHVTILVSALAAGAISSNAEDLVQRLANQLNVIVIAQSFGNPKLVRQLRLNHQSQNHQSLSLKLEFGGDRVIYQGQDIGKIQILQKSPLPGELQAKLAFESAIDRFSEYLQKRYQIIALHDSDCHIQVFIPKTREPAYFEKHWQKFIENVAFSTYGDIKYKLPGLAQTFISMLNTVTLAGRGFSTLKIPVMTKEQANVLAAWYLAVFDQVKKRQNDRQHQINNLRMQLKESELTDKERNSQDNNLQKKKEMQQKEAEKYKDYFQKSFWQTLDQQQSIWQDLANIKNQLEDRGLKKSQKQKLEKQREKLLSQIIFTQESIRQKLNLLQQSDGDPFQFVDIDRKQNSEKFRVIEEIAKSFTKIATDQINSTRGDIFTQVILEMYKLLENDPKDPYPEPLLSEQPRLMELRSPGDDGKDFCYSCGVALDPKTAKWKVARFMFERPSQRRQSSSSEDRPHICASCSALAFASPLKVTDESIILKLEAKDRSSASQFKLKDYLRMLTNKELNLSSGRYVVLVSEKTSSGICASKKLGQVQYTLTKVASIFPQEVLANFRFLLQIQGGQDKELPGRHLIFIKGLMESYGQFIIISGKDINLALGDAVRYVEQDLPYLADYTLVKMSSIADRLLMEKTRECYGKQIQQDIQGGKMNSDQLKKRAKLYRDVAGLTGLTYAFGQSLESTAKKAMKPEDAEREVSKLIEKVDDAVAFCYYATLGDEKKTSVQARLYHKPENYFIYEQTKALLEKLGISDREEKDDKGTPYLQVYADDISRAYAYFADPKNEHNYAQEKDWKNLTYNLKLSLYTRFPELVRKLKSKEEK